MRRVFYFSGMLLCLLFMSSCAGVGALVTITAFGVEGYEEARIHRPDLKLKPIQSHIDSVASFIKLPDLPKLSFFSNQSSKENNAKTSASNAPAAFGFDCSRLGDTKKQSKCFDDFSKTLAKREAQSLKPKYAVTQKVVTPKKDKKLTALHKVTKTLKEAPVTVAKKLSSTTEILPNTYVQSWASAWEKNDISTYISFYSNEYKGTQNHRGAWEASRQRAFKNNKNISIKLSNIQTSEKGKNRVKVNFTQEYKSDGYTDTGIKELLVEKKGTNWKIINETWMPTNALANDKSSTDRSKQVSDKLAGWLKAWEHQDVNTYLSFYSNKFKTPGSHAKWRNTRHHALKANKNLSIQVSNIQTSQTSQNKNIIEINFIQRFNSKKYSDVGIKELVWIKTEGDWKILKETWMPS